MRRAFFRFCLKLTGWNVVGEYPDIPKALIVMAPHTSYWDAVYGKFIVESAGISPTLLTAAEYFYFPLSLGLKILGCYPVGGVKGHNAIMDVVNLFASRDRVQVLICPEGQLKPTDRWNLGFYYMALKANVPIIVGYMDYKKKEAGFKTVITDLSDKDKIMQILHDSYDGVNAKYPESFLLPKLNPSKQ